MNQNQIVPGMGIGVKLKEYIAIKKLNKELLMQIRDLDEKLEMGLKNYENGIGNLDNDFFTSDDDDEDEEGLEKNGKSG